MAAAWPLNLGSARDWAFTALPNPHLNGRAIPMSMGKVPGGGSCINVMLWARGHKSDWDSWAAQAGDPAWSHDSVLAIYRGIENWQGAPDPARRGQNGLLCITPPIDPNPIAPAMLDAAAERSIPVYDDVNGSMMEGPGGASYTLVDNVFTPPIEPETLRQHEGVRMHRLDGRPSDWAAVNQKNWSPSGSILERE